jgi:predicted HicB family RNase H-like nuclease
MQKAPGRPKKSAAATRGETLEIRVTSAEKQAFALAAEIAGIGLSTWVRERLRLSAIRELESAGCRVPFVDPVSLR